jgi:hypothetical protein
MRTRAGRLRQRSDDGPGLVRDAPAEGASFVQRLLRRAHEAWEGEALQAALRRVHNWVGRHRSKILIAILTVVGTAFVAQGSGIL